MPLSDRDYMRHTYSLTCHCAYCEGLRARGELVDKDNNDEHPPYCTCVDCCNKRLGIITSKGQNMTEQKETKEPETFSLEVKQESNSTPLVEQQVPQSKSKYHEFRHFMYTHLQNKWVKTIVVACLAAGVIYLLEILYKAVTK